MFSLRTMLKIVGMVSVLFSIIIIIVLDRNISKSEARQQFNFVYRTNPSIFKERNRLSKMELKQIKRNCIDAPIVVEKYKLVFFFNQKAGCSTWKQILRFLSGKSITNFMRIVHDPNMNGLKDICDYSDRGIEAMMLNSSWLKVAFVREPRQRILSAYLDKAWTSWKLCRQKAKSFEEFLRVIKTCKDDHWESQVRAPKWLYRQMLIGTMSNYTDFTVDLMKRIGAWDSHTRQILTNYRFSPHATNSSSSSKLLTYYNDTRLQDEVFKMFKEDYEMFGFNMDYFKKE